MSSKFGNAAKFILSEEEYQLGQAWFYKHKCSERRNKQRYCSYIFTPNGIGNKVEISCPCGKKQDITNYMNW